MSFDRLVKRIDKKDWNLIRERWLSHIPNLSPGEPPTDQISELTFLQLELDRTNFNENRKIQIQGLRESIFHEGIFLCHKAHSVAKCSSWLHNSGYYTWSISSSYQSAFFLVKSFLCFCGISLPKYSNYYFLVDSFPEPEKLSNRDRKLGKTPEILVKLEKIGNLQHYHIWQIFQRVINTFKNPTFDITLKNAILSLDIKEFAKQRNFLHYQNNHWNNIEDMNNKIFIDNFLQRNSMDLNENFHPDLSIKFSNILMTIMLKMNHSLLEDLNQLTNAFKQDFEMLKKSLLEIPEYKLL